MKMQLTAAVICLISISSINAQTHMETNKKVADRIIALEKAALEEWNKGNPDGYLAIYSEDVTYFDPYLQKRVDGFAAIKTLYEEIRGTFSVDHYEMVDPRVQETTDTAILTYNLHSYSGDAVYKWNCTEVYRLQPDNKWKIAHVHWSYIRPMDMKGF